MILTGIELGFEFKLWSDLIWPIVTPIFSVGSALLIFKLYTDYKPHGVKRELENFWLNINEIYQKDKTDFDKDATSYADENQIMFAIFMLVHGKMDINLKEKSDWNRNHRLNKFRQFYFYLHNPKKIKNYKH